MRLQRIKQDLYQEIKSLKQATYVRYIIEKTIKLCTNQYPDLFRFLFTDDFLQIEKDLEPICAGEIFYKIFIKKLAKFCYQTVFSF